MSDICGRRRLAKLAFVTGASGNLRGFLEEPVHTNYNYRLTDPFAFHAAFLEERLRMQLESTGAGTAVKSENASAASANAKTEESAGTKTEPAQTTEAPEESAPKEAAAAPAQVADPERFLEGFGVSGGVIKELTGRLLNNEDEMKKFKEALNGITIAEEQKRRIGERVEHGSVINKKDRLETPPDATPDTDAKVENLVQRILHFKDAPNQAGLDEGKPGSTLLYSQKEKTPSVVFNVGNQVQKMIDGEDDANKSKYLKMLMHKTMAAAIKETVKVEYIEKTSSDSTDSWSLVKMTKKEKVEPGMVEVEKSFRDVYEASQEGVVIEKLRALRDTGGQIIAGLRGASMSKDQVEDDALFVGLCPNLSGYSPLAEATAGGATSKRDGLTFTAEKFFPNAFMNGIELRVNLEEPWEFRVGGKDDIIFRIDLSKLTGENGDVTQQKIVEDFKKKINEDGKDQDMMNEIERILREEVKARIQGFEVPSGMPTVETPLSEEDINKWNSAKKIVQEFVENRVMVKPQKQTGVKNSVEFFKLFSDPKGAEQRIEVFIGNLLNADFKATTATDAS